VIYPDQALCEKARVVLERYRDQKLSYADAVSFAILETLEISDVFGFDSHFYVANCNLHPVVPKRL